MILRLVKAVADAASRAERPSAASSVCTQHPAIAPSIAARPARRPPATVFARNRLMSGPGVTNRTKQASEYAIRTEASGRKVMAASDYRVVDRAATGPGAMSRTVMLAPASIQDHGRLASPAK